MHWEIGTGAAEAVLAKEDSTSIQPQWHGVKLSATHLLGRKKQSRDCDFT